MEGGLNRETGLTSNFDSEGRGLIERGGLNGAFTVDILFFKLQQANIF